VPAEAHRLGRRITRRDGWFIGMLVLVALVAAAAGIVLSAPGPSAAARAGCVTTLRASIMGGATTRYCGADAVSACRELAPDDAQLAARCERIGVAVRP